MHVEIDVRTTTAKDTSVLAKLMGATEEPTSGVTDDRRHAISRGEQSSLGKLNAGCKLMTRAFKLKAGYMELMGSIPKPVCPRITYGSTKQLGDSENYLLSWQSQRQRRPYLEDQTKRALTRNPQKSLMSDDAGTETPPIVPGRRTVSLSVNSIHEGWSERHI